VNWTLTALNLSQGAASGTWSNTQTTGTGSMSGSRIAQLTGPRINVVSPPGGKPGAWVTIVGQSLSGLSSPNGVVFGQAPQSAVESADATRIVVRVPAGATTGPIQVNTSSGSALSPFLFNLDVRSPELVSGANPPIVQENAPAALAVSPDGRKLYVAYRGNGRFSVVRASTFQNILTRDITGGSPRSIAVSPNGKRVYVATEGIGVLILEAMLGAEVNRVTLAIDGTRDNPQGIAVSPDGRLLAVSDAKVGGSVTVYTISGDTLTVLATHGVGQGRVPLGVAFAPDGLRAYVAAADPVGASDALRLFDPSTGALLDEEIVGDIPTAVAVHPNGNLVFVANQNSSTVDVYNANTHSIASTVMVGAQPTGIAVAPDGARVYVANQGGNSLSALDGANGAVIGMPFSLGSGAPLAIAINPSGTTAYVTLVAANSVIEVGGMRTLTVNRAGTGIGTVTSSPVGIDCGTLCQAQFPVGSNVSLTATAAAGSIFSGWSGSGCGNVVTLHVNMTCTAIFNSSTPPPSEQGGGGCFIATAAYGSDMAHEVQVLRELRGWLMTHSTGRAFVRFYYRNSPPVADFIRERAAARAAVRAMLMPVVWSIEHPVATLAFFLGCVLLGGGLRARLVLHRRWSRAVGGGLR
jgi:YVTN family beta-propeller protein